ncbi:MAG: tetratricopeptide repeat protein [Salinivirgaceae bacterium]|jgi:Flp pilus assembly protein TadD|nr:tetratricopeptide repeat protein [Salinivirgaceae bacterium]
MKTTFSLLILFLTLSLYAQQSQEDHRKAGYQAMHDGKLKKAIGEYAAILELDINDYDARLALGRLYYKTGNSDSALYYYQKIYRNDSTDVEALNGFTKCFIRQGKMDAAINTARRAVQLLPEHVPEYLLLAKALSYDGQIQEAINVYRHANQIDSTYSQVWAGLGKMFYWNSKPATAQKYYRKALKLDPENQIIKKAHQKVKNALKYHFSGKYQYLQEKEDTYQIDAFVQRYSLQKRLGDQFQISANFLLDYSRRDFINDDASDTLRWFDNSWIKASWLAAHHNISVYGGYSVSDDLFSTYGLTWKYQNSFNKLKLENTMDAGYHYFYYWNQVGRHAISNKLELEYSRLSMNVDLNAGQVDEKQIRKYSSDPYEIGTNPYFSYNISIHCKIIKTPDVKVGINHSYFDYKYISPSYYTPNDRLLTGPSVSLYHSFKNFYIYGMYVYHFGTEKFYYMETVSGGNEQASSNNEVEKSVTIDADNWSASFEAGYNWDAVSLSAGVSRFYNPYYQNVVGFITISGKF